MAPKGKSSRGRGGGQNTRATAAGGGHNSRAVAADPVESTRPAAAGGGETSRRGGHQTSSRGGTRTCELFSFVSFLGASLCSYLLGTRTLVSRTRSYNGFWMREVNAHPELLKLVGTHCHLSSTITKVFMKDKDPDLAAFMSSSPLQQPLVIIPPSTQTCTLPTTLPDTTAAAVQPAGLTTGTTPTSPLSNTTSNH
ncbi:hypothetical protein ISN45_Aa08g006600 [Arabidopsis thaliana x Arabidopsis arenosa]|uniref:Uncharacterized protein n=1 Tax=Arabidopsis thaliana x Arabidopsis arenosa TaxID=1240361 RepID=A0A8T1XNU0_9BRAS|nr:hypothetical protein ISN45_Aa08g006600 [Arabidopsis thaliana x Arabidopsis arenosa]